MTIEKDDEDKLRVYRGLIRRDIDELEKKLDTIEQKIDKLNQKFQHELRHPLLQTQLYQSPKEYLGFELLYHGLTDRMLVVKKLSK